MQSFLLYLVFRQKRTLLSGILQLPQRKIYKEYENKSSLLLDVRTSYAGNKSLKDKTTPLPQRKQSREAECKLTHIELIRRGGVFGASLHHVTFVALQRVASEVVFCLIR